MKITELIPAVERSVSFDLYAMKRLTDSSGCYCLTNAGGDILYVGQALSVQQRAIQHFDSPKREALTLYGRISRVWWRTSDAIALSALERGWIEAIRLRDGELPPLNRVSGPV